MVLCGKDCQCVLGWENIMKVWKDLHHWRCPCCYRKHHGSHQAQNNQFLLVTALSRYCAWLQEAYNRAGQGNHERYCGYGKKGRRRRVSRCGSWRNSRVNRQLPQRNSQTMTWWRWELPDQRLEEIEAKPGNRLTFAIWQKGSDYSWLLSTSFTTQSLLGPGHWSEGKQWKKDWYHIGAFLDKGESKKVRHKLGRISRKWNQECLPFLPRLLHPCHPWDRQTSPPQHPPSPRPTQCEEHRDEDLYGDPLNEE